VNSLWRLSAPAGALEKSNNNRGAWQEVRVGNTGSFLALAALGQDVWVATTDGKLFHSVDDGSRWQPVPIAAAGKALTGAITRINVTNEQTVEVSTTTGERWVTYDGGFEWRRL
jgi:photosystem II stability/assembly factor-like uncharacterized protein